MLEAQGSFADPSSLESLALRIQLPLDPRLEEALVILEELQMALGLAKSKLKPKVLVSALLNEMEMATPLELVSALESKAVELELALEVFSPDQLDEPESLNLLDLVAVSTLEFLLALVWELVMPQSLMELVLGTA